MTSVFLFCVQGANVTSGGGGLTSAPPVDPMEELEHIKVSYAMSVTFAVGVMQVRVKYRFFRSFV